MTLTCSGAVAAVCRTKDHLQGREELPRRLTLQAPLLPAREACEAHAERMRRAGAEKPPPPADVLVRDRITIGSYWS